MPDVVARKLYAIALMAAQQIGIDGGGMDISYKCPEDADSPWETLSIRGGMAQRRESYVVSFFDHLECMNSWHYPVRDMMK